MSDDIPTEERNQLRLAAGWQCQCKACHSHSKFPGRRCAVKHGPVRDMPINRGAGKYRRVTEPLGIFTQGDKTYVLCFGCADALGLFVALSEHGTDQSAPEPPPQPSNPEPEAPVVAAPTPETEKGISW